MDIISRNRNRSAEEIADAIIRHDQQRTAMRKLLNRFDPMGECERLIDSDDPGVVQLRAERMGLTYACPENPIFFDPMSDEDDWSQAMLNRDRSGDLTGRWWFPLVVVGAIFGVWLLLRTWGVK